MARARRARPAAALLVAALAAMAALYGSLAVRAQEGPAAQGAEGLERAVVQRVVDGDTIVVELPGGDEPYVRLIGIDAPESVHDDESRNTAEGREASDFLKGILAPGDVAWLERDVSDKDRYGRLLRYVWHDGPAELETQMLNEEIVEAGYAQARRYHPDVKHAEALEAAQERAVRAGRGVSRLWKEDQ